MTSLHYIINIKNPFLRLKPGIKVAAIIFFVLLLDQWLKFHIKLNYEYGQETYLFGQEWAQLKFVENEGMAFGITFDWKYGKLLLSVFRIIMVGGLIWYIAQLIKAKMPNGLVYAIGFITAGAIGNIIDSVFYGLIFTESYHMGGEVAQLVPMGQGYGTFLHGKVVDMLYFPIHNFSAPDWIPYFGGEDYLFFSPIFNIADAAITCGVVSILLFQGSFFKEEVLPGASTAAAAVVASNNNDGVLVENPYSSTADIAASVAGLSEHV
jgi:signal peptidase II